MSSKLTLVMCLMVCIFFLSPTLGSAEALPDSFDPGVPIVASVVFHWYGVSNNGHLRGQYYGPWNVAEGRENWDGSVRFWTEQDRDIMFARFNSIIFQDVYGFRREQRNHLTSLETLRDQGFREVPKVAPFFEAASFECYHCEKDFGSNAGEDQFYSMLKAWFDMYYGISDNEGLVVYKGKVLVFLWHIPGDLDARPGFFERMNDRLEAEYGFRAHWSTHQNWGKGNPDEFNGLFAGMQPFNLNSQGNVDLLVGFWPPNESYFRYSDNMFLARNGGVTFFNAWKRTTEASACELPDIIAVESWNEYTEGSGMFSAFPVCHIVADYHWSGDPTQELCANAPCHPINKYEDCWGTDAMLYMRINRYGVERIEEKLLGYDPRSCKSKDGRRIGLGVH